MMLSYLDLLFDPADGANLPIDLPGQKAKADLDVLRFALVNAYPGSWVADHLSWISLIDGLDQFQIFPSEPVGEFADRLGDVLSVFPDGHLQVRDVRRVCGNRLLQNLRLASTGKNIAADQIWKVETRQANAGDVSVLGISSFPQSSHSAWDGFLEAVGKMKNSSAIVVDLRGNEGGDDTKSIEMMSILLGQELDMSWVTEVICESSAAYALQANTYSTILWKHYLSKQLPAPSDLQAKFELCLEQANTITSTEPRKVATRGLVPPMNSAPRSSFAGKVYVLIDPVTGSSGEWAALYLKRYPNTILVGENSFGMIHFGNSGVLRLPNSRLYVSICMKVNEIPSVGFFEKTGIPPDLQISNQDSLAYVMSNLIS